MAHTKSISIAAAALVFGFASAPAVARDVQLGKHDAAEIESICDGEGGKYFESGGNWNCVKKCKGGTCSVSCDQNGCLGTVPGKRSRTQKSREPIVATLNGTIQEGDNIPLGLLGLLGLAGFLALYRRS